jgi:hypothetical protein
LLTRLECLQILDLGATANTNEIETRYTMLIKRYRGKNDPETIKELDQITLAYNILTGRYMEPEPENPRLEKIIFGKSRRQWQNIWHYGRLPLLGILIGAAFVIYLIVSIVTNKPPDIQIVTAGFFAMTNDADTRIDQYVKEILPGTKKVEYQFLPLDFRDPGSSTEETDNGIDPQNQYAYVIKMVTILAADSIEVYICDQSVYNKYAGQGAFADLDELYNQLQDLPPDILAKIKPQRRYPVEESTATTASGQPSATVPAEQANKDASLPISGLDVSELHLSEGLGIYGESQVLTIGIKAGDPAKTMEFLAKWIRDYEKMHQMQKDYEDTLKTDISQTTAAAG